jgi:hypothetical protein
MSHRRIIGRTLVAALAAATLTTPPALAYPRDMQVPIAAAPAQLDHSPRPGATTTTRLPGPPTWPLHPKPITAPMPAAHAGADHGDTTTAMLAIRLGLLGLGGVSGIAAHTRRGRRRVTA